MSKFTTFANDLLDAEYDTGSSGTLALGPVSSRVNYTLPVKLELTTTVSTAGTPGTPFSGGSYPSGGVSIAGKMAAASAASKASNADISVSGMPAGTWADVYTHDSTGTPKNMNFRGGSSLAKTVNAGDTALIQSGNLTGTES